MSFTDLIFPVTGGDAVAVFDANFNQVFSDARPMRCDVYERSRMLEHPIETGQVITDYSVILPIEIEMQMLVESANYRDMYQQILNLYQTKQYLTVQTRANSYASMVIAEMPHVERPDIYDALPITLRFKQIFVVTSATNFAPADATQADIQSLGEQTSYPITPVSSTTTGVAPVQPPPALTGATPSSAQQFYSSVQSSQLPSGYTIQGVQTPSGTASIPLNQAIPVGITEPQTLTSASSVSSVFSAGFVPIGSAH